MTTVNDYVALESNLKRLTAALEWIIAVNQVPVANGRMADGVFATEARRALAAVALSAPATRVVSFDYINYRGEKSRRNVSPVSLRFGSSEWHPEPQFLLLAFDRDKSDFRGFALKSMSNVLPDEFLNERAPAQGNIPQQEP